MLTLALVIPVFNEEHHIAACLDAIARQSVLPDEVIVVDNNCSDRTVAIAKNYSFVRVVAESKQGRGHARNAGFNAANSNIIGRIDADSQLDSDWVEQVKHHFEQNDALAGLTGLARTPIFPFVKWPTWTFYARSYYWHVHGFFGTITTWGATMAVRQRDWDQVKDLVCLDDKLVHEDQDIALWMAGKSMKVQQTNDVRILSISHSFRYLPKMLWYNHLRNKTRTYHIEKGNLPAIGSIRMSTTRRVISHLLSIPAIIYGLLYGLLFLIPDWLAIHVFKSKTWFN